jgi:hypothetical protein
MFRRDHQRLRTWVVAAGAILLLCGVSKSAPPEGQAISFVVVVKEADTGDPINQARLTLIFRQPGSIRRSKTISYSAKTNPQGRYRFTSIPKGTVRLVVTADHHQSFGKDVELEQDNQVVEIKLKKPQPLL